MGDSERWLLQELEARGVSRREFMGFCAAVASTLALPGVFTARIG